MTLKHEVYTFIISIVAILAAFIIYGMQVCNDRSNFQSGILIEIENSQNLLSKYKHDLIEIRTKRSRLWSEQETFISYQDANISYLKDIELHEKVDNHIQMASRVIKIYGENNNFLDKERWNAILRKEGFKLGAPIREVMVLISTSSITVSMPIGIIIKSPHDAQYFIDELTSWKNTIDSNHSRLKENIMVAFNLEAGEDLEGFLSDKLDRIHYELVKQDNDIKRLNAKTINTKLDLVKLNKLLSTSNIPEYCIL